MDCYAVILTPSRVHILFFLLFPYPKDKMNDFNGSKKKILDNSYSL